MPLRSEDIETTLKVLEQLLEHREDLLEIDLDVRKRLLEIAGRLAQPEAPEQRYLARAARKKRRRDTKVFALEEPESFPTAMAAAIAAAAA